MLLGFFDFETPSPCGFPLFLLFLIPDLFAACFDLTVDVLEGAIANICNRDKGNRVAGNLEEIFRLSFISAAASANFKICSIKMWGKHLWIIFTSFAKMAARRDQRVRSAAIARDTNETKIVLAINLDGGEFPADTDDELVNSSNGGDGHASQASKSQTIAINSGIGFLDHMLHALAKHAGWSLALNCRGDLHSTFQQTLLNQDQY